MLIRVPTNNTDTQAVETILRIKSPGLYLADTDAQAFERIRHLLSETWLSRQQRPVRLAQTTQPIVQFGSITTIDTQDVSLSTHQRFIKSVMADTPAKLSRALSDVPEIQSLYIKDQQSAVRIDFQPLVLISDMLAPFYDLTLREGEVWSAFQSTMIELCRLKQRAIVIGLVSHWPIPYDRRHLWHELTRWQHRRLEIGKADRMAVAI